MDIKISNRYKDIIQKYVSGLFKNKTLEFYGLKTSEIKELINVEFPIVEVSDASADYVFLLDDGTYLHLEFQSSYDKKDLTRFARYDSYLYDRDERNIQTVVVFTADVKQLVEGLNIGTLAYNPHVIMLDSYDGSVLYNELEQTIKSKNTLKDIDMLNLIFLPLMRNNIPTGELAVKSMKLAKTIPDRVKRNTCMASIFALTRPHVDEIIVMELLEVLKMSNVLEEYLEEEISKGINKGINEKIAEKIAEKETEFAKNLLKKGSTVDFIKDVTDLSIEEILKIQAELNNQ